MLLVLLFGLILIVIYLKFVSPLREWKQKGIAYVSPWTGFVKALIKKESFPHAVIESYKKFPKLRYYGSYQFLNPSLFIRDLDLIKQVTVKDFDHFTDHMGVTSEKTDPIFSLSLFTLKGKKWRAMRSTLSPTFTSSKMKIMYNLILETADTFVDHFLKKDQTIIKLEMKDVFSKFTNDVIANCAFGIKLNSLENPDNEFNKMGRYFVSLPLPRLLRRLLYGVIPRVFEFFNFPAIDPGIPRFFQKLIKETIELREKNGIVRPDMIHILMEARKGKLKPERNDDTIDTGFATVQEENTGKDTLEITDDIITAQALLFFVAGFTTASSLMSFLAYELAINPEIQEILHKEIAETIEKCKGNLTYEILLGMKYLDQVVSEALRKWTPGFILNRLCVKDYIIKPQNANEIPIVINKGSLIAIPVMGIHYDPVYWPEPNRFNPDRFSEENRTKIVSGSYLPFGVGPRNCIGSRFALLEIKTLMVKLLWKFELVPIAETKIPLELGTTLPMEVKGGAWVGFKKRI